MAIGICASFITEKILGSLFSSPFCHLIWSSVFYYNSFRAPSYSGIPHRIFSVSFKALPLKSPSFTLLTLFQSDLISLHSFTDSQISLLHWPLPCCSASHLDLSVSVPTSTHSPFLSCPLLSGSQDKLWTKTYPGRSELQEKTRVMK